MMVTILTPTYNRKDHLSKLFDSLCKQTNQKFQWLLIDDGSTDGTEEWFKQLKKTDFQKEYYKKKNGGKHTALNYSHPYILGELVMIVDSDDWVVSNAVEIIENDWKKYRHNSNICGITYLKGEKENIPLGNFVFPNDEYISDSITEKVNAKKCVDSCEVIRRDVMKEFSFPEFDAERFIGESYLWNLSGYKYRTVYCNRVLYVAEYLDGGLTKSGRCLRIRCPLGGMENSKTYFDSRVCLRQRIKNTWLYVCYGKFAGWKIRKIIRESGQIWTTFFHYIFGLGLYYFWKYKYCGK